MKRRTVTLFLFAGLLSMLTWACSQPAVDLEQAAQDFVDLLVEEKFDDAVKTFDSTMKTVMPADKLGEVWEQILRQVGTFDRKMGTRMEIIDTYDVVFVTCKFANATLLAKVVFDSDKKIAGLFFLPAP